MLIGSHWTSRGQRVDVWVSHDVTAWACPECASALAGFDHSEARTWRHLDTCQFETHLHARVAAGAVSDARGAASGGAVGGAAEPLHVADGATGD